MRERKSLLDKYNVSSEEQSFFFEGQHLSGLTWTFIEMGFGTPGFSSSLKRGCVSKVVWQGNCLSLLQTAKRYNRLRYPVGVGEFVCPLGVWGRSMVCWPSAAGAIELFGNTSLISVHSPC